MDGDLTDDMDEGTNKGFIYYSKEMVTLVDSKWTTNQLIGLDECGIIGTNN